MKAEDTTPQVYRQLGQIMRQLHDTLQHMDLMPALQQSAQHLPDARSRLDYIAHKTGEAAERVLSAVEQAKLEHDALQAAAHGMARRCGADPSRVLPAPEVLAFAGTVESAAARIDQRLTEIMLAQDFHDLTGQVVARVVSLVMDLESSLLQVLVKGAAGPAEPPPPAAGLHGPQVITRGGADTLHSQREVDELLASLGF